MQFTITEQEIQQVVKAAVNYRDEAKFEFRDKGILMRIQDESNTALYNSFIPKTMMDTYEPDKVDALGVRIDDLDDILSSSQSEVGFEFDASVGGKLTVSMGNRSYKTPAIDPEEVRGSPDAVPSGLELPVKIRCDPNLLLDFINDCHSYVFNDNSGGYWLSANEGVMVMFSKRDDYELVETFHWEDFSSYDISWSDATPDKKQAMGINNPQENKRIEVLLSTGLTKDMSFFTDEIVFEFGHGMPIKAVSETEEGVKHSWIVPPRFPTQSETTQVPDRVIKERAVV